MRSIRFLEHTADICVRLEGDSFQELLLAGMEVIHRLLFRGACEIISKPDIEEEINIQSMDHTSLLIDFLSEVLTASYNQKAVFCDLEVIDLQSFSLKAKIFGKRVPHFSEDIKAVTYHEAEVSQNAEGQWETLIILDI